MWCYAGTVTPQVFLFNPNRRSTLLALVKSRSTWVLTSKNSPKTLITPLIKWTHMCGQTMVKALVKPHSNPVILDVFRNFCRVLQNSPKHLKIYLYESCPACWGTQLSCRLAFQILRGKRWKTCSKVSTSCSWQLSGIQSWQALPVKSIEKKQCRDFLKVVGDS
jgi:hypothetical protein